MRFLFVLTAFTLFLSACRKESSNQHTPIEGNLAGKWQMVWVKDNVTNNTTVKPASIKGDVDITISFINLTDGMIEGVTPSNYLAAKFSIGENQAIFISELSTTEVMETSWGALFQDNIIHAQDYVFYKKNELNINTSTKKRLTFIRQ